MRDCGGSKWKEGSRTAARPATLAQSFLSHGPLQRRFTATQGRARADPHEAEEAQAARWQDGCSRQGPDRLLPDTAERKQWPVVTAAFLFPPSQPMAYAPTFMRSPGVWTGTASLGDQWKWSPSLQSDLNASCARHQQVEYTN